MRRLSNLTLGPGSMGTLELSISCRLHQPSLSLMGTADDKMPVPEDTQAEGILSKHLLSLGCSLT